jgi:hypothetical protein
MCADSAFASMLRPKQTWQVSGLSDVCVSMWQPVLVAARLRGIMRVDDVDSFSLDSTMRQGGQGCILLERLIHEIAYKVARAPKYGS